MTSFRDLAQKMHEKSKEFDAHLTDLKKLNDELRDRSGKVLEAITNLCGNINIPKTCTVCYTRPGMFACVPCYHGGLCNSCATSNQPTIYIKNMISIVHMTDLILSVLEP